MKKPNLIHRIITHARKHVKRYLVAATVLAFGYYGVAYFGGWGAAQLELNSQTIEHTAWSQSEPIKIAFFADLHNNAEKFKDVIELIKEQKPDLIIFGGDLVTADERFRRTAWAIKGFQMLQEVAPTYVIFGNHDYEKQEQVERVYKTAGVQLLRNETTVCHTSSGKALRIIALGDINEGDINRNVFSAVPTDENLPILLLSHDPESRHAISDCDWDVMLSGHTHGGQLGIPFTEHYISFRSTMPAGLFDYEDNRKVFVTRGIGSILGMRFFCAPEVNIITIQAPAEQ